MAAPRNTGYRRPANPNTEDAEQGALLHHYTFLSSKIKKIESRYGSCDSDGIEFQDTRLKNVVATRGISSSSAARVNRRRAAA